MSRYTPVDDLMLAIHEQVIAARATRDRPLTRGQINAIRKECGAIVGQAIDRLVDGGLLATMRLTRDSTTHDVYWPTGLKPIIPPTDEERRMSTESKTDRLVRLITTHGGRINAVDLSAKAKAEGYDIPAKNVQGLLTSRVNRGDIELIRDGRTTYYDTPRKKTAASLGASEDDDAMPPAEAELPESHRAAFEKRITGLEANINGIERERAALDDVVNALCGALGVNTAIRALDEITRLKSLDDRPTGRLAMLLHSGDDADLDYFAPFISETDAVTLSMRQVDTGHAERVTLIRVLGEATRRATVWTPMVTPPIATLNEQEA